MGDGARLKEILDEKGITVAKLARDTTISNQTIYTIIKRDTAIRFDFALRIANVLGIDPKEICSDENFIGDDISETETLPTMPSGLDSLLDDKRVKRYINSTMYPLMQLYGKESMADIDKLLTYYYQLTDEGREEVTKYLEERYALKKDPKRAEEIKKITRW